MELLRRILKEIWAPSIVAVAWGLITYHNQAEKNVVIAFGAAASAFFLVFFFQGQVLRIRKNIRDEENDERTYQGVSSLAEAVDEIRVMLQGKPVVPPAPPPVNHFFNSAAQAFNVGLYYSAVLTAAQGFEHEARRAVHMAQSKPMNASLGRLLLELRDRLPPTSVKQLTLLNRTRNTLVHETTPDSITRDQAEELIAGFAEGAELLRSLH